MKRVNEWYQKIRIWQLFPVVIITAYICMVLGLLGYLSWYVIQNFSTLPALISFTTLLIIGGVLIVLGAIKLVLKFEEMDW